MKKALIFLAVVLTALNLNAQSSSEINRYIEVTGKAEKEFTPDQIYTKLVITESNVKGQKSLDKIENELFKELTKIGVDVKEDITISDVQAQLEQFFLKKDFIASSREYNIMVSNSAKLVQLFTVLKKLGQTNATVTHAKLSDPEAAGRQLLTEAAANAQKSAEAIATGLGQKLGRAIYAQSYPSFQGQIMVGAMARTKYSNDMMQEESSYEVPDFKKIKLTQSVTVRFEIK